MNLTGARAKSEHARDDLSAAQNVVLGHYSKVREVYEQVQGRKRGDCERRRALDRPDGVPHFGEYVVRIGVADE